MRVVAAVLLSLHVAAGIVAVGGGLVALVTAKGGRRHRAAGRVFAAAMLGVILSAAMLVAIAPNAYLAALTVGAAAPAFSGYRVLRRKRPDLDPRQRATALDWSVTVTLLIAAVAAFSGSVLVLLDPPWRQLWAVLLGQWLTVFFLVRHRREARDARERTA